MKPHLVTVSINDRPTNLGSIAKTLGYFERSKLAISNSNLITSKHCIDMVLKRCHELMFNGEIESKMS